MSAVMLVCDEPDCNAVHRSTALDVWDARADARENGWRSWGTSDTTATDRCPDHAKKSAPKENDRWA